MRGKKRKKREREKLNAQTDSNINQQAFYVPCIAEETMDDIYFIAVTVAVVVHAAHSFTRSPQYTIVCHI